MTVTGELDHDPDDEVFDVDQRDGRTRVTTRISCETPAWPEIWTWTVEGPESVDPAVGETLHDCLRRIATDARRRHPAARRIVAVASRPFEWLGLTETPVMEVVDNLG